MKNWNENEIKIPIEILSGDGEVVVRPLLLDKFPEFDRLEMRGGEMIGVVNAINGGKATVQNFGRLGDVVFVKQNEKEIVFKKNS